MSAVADERVAETGGPRGDDGGLPRQEDLEETTEERKPKRMADPLKPSAKEVEEHGLTHLPYRSWCWVCVHGKAKNAPHAKVKEERTIPEIHLDFAFLGPGTHRMRR